MIEEEFKHKIKISFKKAKEHIESIEKEILNQKKEFLELNKKLEVIFNENRDLKEKLSNFISSTGNKGVKQINKQINKQTIKQLSIPNIKEIEERLKQSLKNLTKQELKTFLSIYQLNEEKEEVSYIDVANTIGITESCIRIYIANLIKKGAPIIKTKINNKKVSLSIKDGFKQLNLKQKLVDIYYNIHPDQTKLT